MSMSRLWLFLAVALPVLAALLANLPSVDLAYHLRAGAEIIDARAIPTVDTWTFTMHGEAWLDQQWGSQLVLAIVERLGGWTALAVVRAVLVGWIFGCLLLVARRRGLDARTAALLVLAAFLASVVTLALRPQLLGVASFATVLLLVALRREHPRVLWVAPVLVAVWANLHGSFFLGPLVLGLAWLEDVHDGVPARHRTLVVAVTCALAACLTPFGPMVWVYAVGLSLDPLVTSRITEWQPTSLRDVPGIAFFASALAVAAFLARRRDRTPWPTLAWLGVFFLIGVYAIRGVAWWPLAAVAAVAPLLPSSADGATQAEPRWMRRINIGVATAVVVAIFALLPAWRPIDPGLMAPAGVVGNAPSGITAALRETTDVDDRLFNPQPWGSWFIYALPHLPVVIDSRIELFPPEIWDQYEAVTAGVEGWEDQLEAWGVTHVVAAGDDAEALGVRLTRAGWSETYRDEDGSVFVRNR